MASNIKDAVKGLRKATEDFERDVMERQVYKLLSNYPIKEIMMEEEGNKQYKGTLQTADNDSAIFECYRNIKAGSKNKYFFIVITKEMEKENYSDTFTQLARKIYKAVSHDGYVE